MAYAAFATEAESLAETAKVLDPVEFEKAVEALSKAERIGAAGCGHSLICCEHFTHLMNCIERPAITLSPAQALHGELGFIQKGDVMLFVSRGGKTDELVKMLGTCKAKGATIITVTENPGSILAESADIVLLMKVTKETDRYNCQGTTSFAVTSAIFDALQCAVLENTGFTNDKFAAIHPGGAVGKRLNAEKKQ